MSLFTCATIPQWPSHAIVTLESVAALLALLFTFFAYARYQRAQRDATCRPLSSGTLRAALATWVVVAVAIPFAVHAANGTGMTNWPICAPAALVQCVAWFAVVVSGIGWLMSRDVSAHLRERAAAGQPAFAPTAPMPPRRVASNVQLSRIQPSSTQRQEARMWARHGDLARFSDSTQ